MLMRILMILLALVFAAPAISQEICVSTPEGREAALKMLAQLKPLEQAPPVPFMPVPPTTGRGVFDYLDQKTPWGTPMPYHFGQYGQPESRPPAEIDRDLVPDARACLGQYQCLHNELHPFYKYAFRKLGCHCHTGKCRPTEARRVNLSDENKTGYQVLANGRWCDVPPEALRRDRQLIPPTLLQFRAHVCVSEHSCAQLECAIIDEGT